MLVGSGVMSDSQAANNQALFGELRQKESDLALAAHFGKNLCEENERLKKELGVLMQDCANLEEVSGYNNSDYPVD